VRGGGEKHIVYVKVEEGDIKGARGMHGCRNVGRRVEEEEERKALVNSPSKG